MAVVTDNMPGFIMKEKHVDVFTSAADDHHGRLRGEQGGNLSDCPWRPPITTFLTL